MTNSNNEYDEIRNVLKDHAAKSQKNNKRKDLHTAEYQESMEQPIVGYRMTEKMGSGGMGAVFKAENIDTENTVALKLLFPGHDQDKNVLQQFINEGMTLIKLEHPNILRGLDFGVSKGIYFLALEYLQGESLLSFLEKGLTFTEKHTFLIALQICEALCYLESKKIVHRDIKPANILIVEDVVKLCDFALCLDLSRKDSQNSEVTCGTVEYISPEQARSDVLLDSRSDIYSLGITCIHMITGKLPFSGKSGYEVMRQQIYEPILLDKLGRFSPVAQKIIQRMVEKDREKRFSASSLLPILKKILGIRK